jgi:hypothetical protein
VPENVIPTLDLLAYTTLLKVRSHYAICSCCSCHCGKLHAICSAPLNRFWFPSWLLQRDFASARSLYEKSLTIARQYYAPNDPGLAPR